MLKWLLSLLSLSLLIPEISPAALQAAWAVVAFPLFVARRAEGPEPVEPGALRELAGLVREGVEQTRVLARGLTPTPLADGLASGLEALAARTNAAGVTCAFDLSGHPLDHESEVARNLYHIAQEAVANAVRHGRPSRVDIRLTIRPSTLTLDVRDDGAGIPETAPEGLGMRTMRQRAELLGAVLRVRSNAEGGTAISCVLPIDGNG
jgi:signal transduction histidine kinase